MVATLAGRRYVRLAPKVVVEVGQLAATNVVHPFIADEGTGTSCLACFGWSDDPKHTTLRRATMSIRTRVAR